MTVRVPPRSSTRAAVTKSSSPTDRDTAPSRSATIERRSARSYATCRYAPSTMLARRTASMPLPRTSPMIMRMPYGRVQRLVQVAADVGGGARRDVPGRRWSAGRSAGRSGSAPPVGPPAASRTSSAYRWFCPCRTTLTATAPNVAIAMPMSRTIAIRSNPTSLTSAVPAVRAAARPPTPTTYRQGANAAARNGAIASQPVVLWSRPSAICAPVTTTRTSAEAPRPVAASADKV